MKTNGNAFTNAQRRRFIASEKRKHPNVPPQLWQRFVCFIDNAWGLENGPDIVPFSVWVAR